MMLVKQWALDFTEEGNIVNAKGDAVHVFDQMESKEFQHRLRDIWRKGLLDKLQQRRPHYHGLDAEGGIDAKSVRTWISQLEAVDMPLGITARYLVTDAYRPAQWMSTHVKFAGEPKYSPTCPNCGEEDEDMEHILWRCTCWSAWRHTPRHAMTGMPAVVQRTLFAH